MKCKKCLYYIQGFGCEFMGEKRVKPFKTFMGCNLTDEEAYHLDKLHSEPNNNLKISEYEQELIAKRKK